MYVRCANNERVNHISAATKMHAPYKLPSACASVASGHQKYTADSKSDPYCLYCVSGAPSDGWTWRECLKHNNNNFSPYWICISLHLATWCGPHSETDLQHHSRGRNHMSDIGTRCFNHRWRRSCIKHLCILLMVIMHKSGIFNRRFDWQAEHCFLITSCFLFLSLRIAKRHSRHSLI